MRFRRSKYHWMPPERYSAMKTDDEQPIKELDMSENIEESLPIYNEEYLIKMLADVSQHKPITLAEAIAYEYLDIEDPKLGLSNETIQRIKHLFRPVADQNSSNLIRVKRSGEYLTDVQLSETNPFEKFNETEPLVYQLQQSFEPTLDFNEKQFRSLTEAILNNKEQYDQLEFDIARTSLPVYDLKESSTNDFSQSDSGYSMTTATHESLASKVKIEFEPIHQDLGAISPKSDDFYEHEKVDLDKASQEQLEKFELNQDLIQIIKSDFNSTDKTIGQAILSRELRLDSTDPSDISYLNSLGIHDEQKRILTAFFFPKQTRIIAYSPEPGRFVEAQTTFNPDYSGYKTDTTIIQIQEKQLSSDQLAMQRNIHDDRTQQQQIITEPKPIATPAAVVAVPPKEKTPPPATSVQVKKRKSAGTGGLLSCFKSKKPKSGTEQQGQPTVLVSQTSTTQEKRKLIEERPLVDYAILPDGKRIYIDEFRDRPGMDMSYKPENFENRFVLPVAKSAAEYERPITPEIEPRAPAVKQKSIPRSESPPALNEGKVQVHLEPRPATIEPVDVQAEPTPIVVFPSTKSQEKTVTKKSTTIDLHGAAVDLPAIQLVTPGPLPTLSISKEKKTTNAKKPTGGLCASCFGTKSASKKNKETVTKPVAPPPPIESRKSIEKEEKKDLSTITEIPSAPEKTVDEPILPRVNIDIFKERNFQKGAETLPKSKDRLATTVEKSIPVVESQQLSSSSAGTVPQVPKDTSISPRVNIDTFRERTFQKSSDTIQEIVTPPPSAEPLYQSPKNEPISPPISTTPPAKDASTVSQVNIDTFKERTFQKSSEDLPESQESPETVPSPSLEEPLYQLPKNEPITPSVQPTTNDTSILSQDNVDTFEKSSEDVPQSEELLIQPAALEEPHYQLPTNESITPPFPTSHSFERIVKDSSPFSQVNIDSFKERKFDRHFESHPKSEEPHYESPSGEPVPPVSNLNTYDIPRTLNVEQTSSPSNEKIIKNEGMTPIPTTTTTNIQKSSDDVLPTGSTKEKSKKSSFTLPLKKKKSKSPSKKKSSLLSTFFRPNERNVQVPALNLPSVERDLSPNNPLRPPHRHDSDPLRVPLIDLPKLDLPLPNYDRPEVNMTTGSIKQSSEFAIPVIDFPPIPDLSLPEESKQLVQFDAHEMKVPHVQLPDLHFTLTKQEVAPTIQSGLALSSPIDDLLSIQTDHKSFPIETDYAIKSETVLSTLTTKITEVSSSSSDQQVTIIDTYLVQCSEVPKQELGFQLPSTEPVLTVSKYFKAPSFDDDVPSPPSKLVPAARPSEPQPIELKKKSTSSSSPLALCSCFGQKSAMTKETTSSTLSAPKASLPEVEMPLPSSNISSTLKTKGSLRAPSNDLPAVNLTPTVGLSTPPKSSPAKETEAVVPSAKIKAETSPPIEQTKVVSIESKKSSSFDIKAPTMNIPPVDFSGPSTSEAYLSFSKSDEATSAQLQSRSDSGLEAIVSSHVYPSSTFGTHTTLGDIQQLPSASSGFGSGIFDSMTSKGYSLPDIQLPEPTLVPQKHDFTRQITLNDETRAKLIFRQDELKACLEKEIAQSIEDYDAKKDQKSLDKILTQAIDLIKEKKVSTYPELKQKLLVEHKTEASIVDSVVRSLYYTLENHELDNLDKPEFPLAIRDMVRLPAKQTYDTVAHLNKESASLSTAQMTKETARSCLTCGRSKSKVTLPTLSSSSLLDERRRGQLNTHRNDLGTLLRDHIQSSQPPIRQFVEHPKEVEKLLRKNFTLLTQPKTLSYEQVRNELKTEFKQTFYLVDPTVDIVRDTLDHCDITQMNEKTNLDILDSNISQTANLYNHQVNLLNPEEHNAFKSNQLSWLQSYLLNHESKEKKLTRKQSKEFNKILHRTIEILSSNAVNNWDELVLQLQREYPKAHDLCQRSIELLKQSQRDGLFRLQQAPIQEKRRASALITDRARQNLKGNRNQIILSLKNFFLKHNPTSDNDGQLTSYLTKALKYLEEQKPGQFKSYQDLKEQLKKDFHKAHQDQFIEQIVDVVEQAHATNQFDDIEKAEVQILLKDRLDGKPLIIKEMYVSLPPRVGAYGDDSMRYSSASTNGDRTTTSHRVGRGLSWREANERARILFYRGKHPAIHYDEQAAAFDVRMLLETASGGTQEIPVTDSDVHELLNSCGVQWDGVNIISLVDHSEDVVRAAEQAALRVIREKGLVDIRTPPTPSKSTTSNDELINSSS